MGLGAASGERGAPGRGQRGRCSPSASLSGSSVGREQGAGRGGAERSRTLCPEGCGGNTAAVSGVYSRGSKASDCASGAVGPGAGCWGSGKAGGGCAAPGPAVCAARPIPASRCPHPRGGRVTLGDSVPPPPPPPRRGCGLCPAGRGCAGRGVPGARSSRCRGAVDRNRRSEPRYQRPRAGNWILQIQSGALGREFSP